VAQAQSSVTVYGTLDAGFRRDDTGSNLNGVTTGLVSNTLTSDRLGFRGTEDLGGGQRAFFQLETGMVPFTSNNGPPVRELDTQQITTPQVVLLLPVANPFWA